MIQPLHGHGLIGAQGLAKLNELIRQVNSLGELHGDAYVGVTRGPGGGMIQTNIDAILARVPRPVPAAPNAVSGDIWTGSFVFSALGTYRLSTNYHIGVIMDARVCIWNHTCSNPLNPAAGQGKDANWLTYTYGGLVGAGGTDQFDGGVFGVPTVQAASFAFWVEYTSGNLMVTVGGSATNMPLLAVVEIRFGASGLGSNPVVYFP